MLNKIIRNGRMVGAFALTMGFALSASAGLIGVKTIEVTNGTNEWLQVAEVDAFNTSSVDVASIGFATASAPDWWDTWSQPGKAIDGVTAGNQAAGQIFHEGDPRSGDTLTITFLTVQELNSFAIWGRTDCCAQRDIYNISFRDSSGLLLYSLSGFNATADNQHVARALLPNTSVPEPATLALLGLGLAGLGFSRRKQ